MEIWRIFRSKHTRDLQLIFVAIVLLLVAILYFNFSLRIENPPKDSVAASIIIAFVGAFIAVLGWLYRTGSQRLTLVDAIASEIFSICRAAAALTTMQNWAVMYRSGDPCSIRYTQVTEEYNTTEKNIFTATNVGFLTQDTIRRINAFYVSLKIMRDRFRTFVAWANATCGAQETHQNGPAERVNEERKELEDECRKRLASLIYTYYLCMENARIGLYRLLEKGDFRIDAVFVCFVTDIRAVTFLLKEARQKDLRSYSRHRLQERIDKSYNECPQNEAEEFYVFEGYGESFDRYAAYLQTLDDESFRDDFKDLFSGIIDKRERFQFLRV